MFGTLGGPEVILILVVALIVFGPRRLPEIGKSMGKMLAEFRKASNDFKRTIEDELEAEKARESAPPPVVETPVAAAAMIPPATAPPIPGAESASVEGAPVQSVSAESTPASEVAASGVGATPAPPAVEPRVEPPAEVVVSRGPADSTER
jgi:TatA/E family protein of Tat protein translocase